jgi:hypothetical protein
MASDPFDFSDVFADLENKIDAFMKDEATKEAASRIFAETAYSDNEDDLVYSKYDPSEYARRGRSGGLADFHNYHVLNIGKMNMTIINETMGNSAYASGFGTNPSDGWNAGYINDIIESGRGYNWTRSRIYKKQLARPFMDAACDKFVDDYLLPSIHDIYFND